MVAAADAMSRGIRHLRMADHVAPVDGHAGARGQVGDELRGRLVLRRREAAVPTEAFVLDPDRVQVDPAVPGVPGDVGEVLTSWTMSPPREIT